MIDSLSSAPIPLDAGDFALRFRIVIRGDLFRPHKCVEGVEAVYIVAIKGDMVTWTNGRKNNRGGLNQSTCPRNELIPLRALEFNPLESTRPSPATSKSYDEKDQLDRADAPLTHSGRYNRLAG